MKRRTALHRIGSAALVLGASEIAWGAGIVAVRVWPAADKSIPATPIWENPRACAHPRSCATNVLASGPSPLECNSRASVICRF